MTYVNDGQRVFAPFKGRWVPCVVVCAMGNTARVVNLFVGLDTWFDVGELRPAKAVS